MVMDVAQDDTARSSQGSCRLQPTANRVAVVLIHGIGEQRPMVTLRTFVHTFVAQTHFKPLWTVPDRCDSSFELHSYVVPATTGRPQVDFYEGYWAPAVRGTRLAHLLSWARRLVLRSPGSLPLRVRWLWWFVLITSVSFAGLVGWLAWRHGEDATWSQAFRAIGLLLLPALVAGVTSSLGDAARYFDARPENIAARSEVRKHVVGLLENLHNSGRYRNVIVVGHSLGGVVAYDALRLLWARRVVGWDASRLDDAETASRAQALHKSSGQAVDDVARRAFGAARDKLFEELSTASTTPPWMVSDLITVGAPLAYPEILLAPTRGDLDALIQERAVPTCPPQLADSGGRPTFRYVSRRASGDIKVLHHGAMFAATRWTNIYAKGDFVGGDVPPVLGKAVQNVALDARQGAWTSWPIYSHTRYWRKDRAHDVVMLALRRAIELSGREGDLVGS